ncbi:putative surface protease GP63, putative,metallopeptidase [Trypanosoma theileri]|uniref:Leishmanolysin-like peptidase n=1 Tax=Trypanosoma theileri TaxID=67003 RepID=A0A1X0NL30_9TRYP|nr:putative surface protease GP63, putative,metallopeptidase [Trypanosoma theileri]ORC85347.1 putative surface protease GP63, putative,metallopeptidase [Trypanosoma theileri]
MLVGAEFNGDVRGSIGHRGLKRPRHSGSSQTVKIREDPSEGWKPIRIKLVSDHLKKGEHHCSDKLPSIKTLLNDDFKCTTDDILTEEKRKILVEEILPEAVKLHKERLFVKPLKGPIVVPEFTNKDGLCSKFIPEAHKTNGVDGADMVLFVAATPTTEETFVWAATCAKLDSDGRPVVGIINYGPRYIVATPQRVRVAAHEIAHALGFNLPEMERKELVGKGFTLRNKSNVALVTSDNTRREAIDHYNCDTAEGMELRGVPNPFLRPPTNGGSTHGGRTNAGRQQPPHRLRPHSGANANGITGGTMHGRLPNPSLVRQQRQPRSPSGAARPLRPEGPAVLALTASVQEEYEVGELHSNAMDGRFAGEESVGSVVEERREEEGSSDAKFTQNVHHSSNDISKRRSLHVQAAMMASENKCAKGRRVENAAGATECIVEAVRPPPSGEKIITLSHWSRRNAKDELMVGLVGAGYYTALTLGAFADLGYYKVDWTMAEQMSWGNNAGCEFLNNKCVNSGETDFSNMFCTTKSTDSSDSPAGLQCTSDRQSLGRCSSIGAIPVKNDLPVGFRYFSDSKTVGSEAREQMDFCPFITANQGYSCVTGEEKNKMPGSVIANNSRCVEGKDLKTKNDAAVGAVCVEVSCKFNKVSVRYSGNNDWHSCPEEENLTLNGTVLQGKIVCPKYADVCNTINRTLDESQGPASDPDPVKAIQTSQPEVETTTTLSEGTQPATEATETPKPSESAGTSNNAGNQGVSVPVVQNEASTTKESKPSETKEENITSSVSGQNNKIVAGKGIDGSFKASAFASVMFLFLTLSVIMLP